MHRILPLLFALTLATSAGAERAVGQVGTCYLRQYSADHLQDHPQQRVTGMGLVLYPDGNQIFLDLYVKVRPGPALGQATAYCTQDGEGLDCLVEGDAGRFSLTGANNGALRLSVAPRGISLDGPQDFITLSGTKGDDKVFLLPPLGDADCARLSAAGAVD